MVYLSLTLCASKQVQESRGDNIYQNASTDLTGEMYGCDTTANANNINQEEEATYHHLHQDANETL